MKRLLPLAALALALAACSQRPPPPAETPANAALRAQCAREAENDPEVGNAIALASGRAGYTSVGRQQEVIDAKRDAIQRCLEAHGGLGLGGGVEVPRW